MNRLDTLEKRLAKLEEILSVKDSETTNTSETPLQVNDLVITYYFKHESEECVEEMYPLCGKVGRVVIGPNSDGLVSVLHEDEKWNGSENWNWPATACIKIGTHAPIKRGDFVRLKKYFDGQDGLTWMKHEGALVGKVFEVKGINVLGNLKLGNTTWPASAAVKVSK